MTSPDAVVDLKCCVTCFAYLSGHLPHLVDLRLPSFRYMQTNHDEESSRKQRDKVQHPILSFFVREGLRDDAIFLISPLITSLVDVSVLFLLLVYTFAFCGGGGGGDISVKPGS